MTKLFPDWFDSAFRLVAWGSLLSLALALGGLYWFFHSPYHTDEHDPVDQPVEFDHRHHVQDDGISCLYCHASVLTSSTAGMPSTEVCMGCHSQIWAENPPIEHLLRSFVSGLPLQWNRVHDLPDFVYFNHSIHVTKGVGCVECHGRVDKMARVYKVKSLQMQWCLDCHRDPLPHLRDPRYVFSMSWQSPGSGRAYAQKRASELRVTSLIDCYTCHR